MVGAPPIDTAALSSTALVRPDEQEPIRYRVPRMLPTVADEPLVNSMITYLGLGGVGAHRIEVYS